MKIPEIKPGGWIRFGKETQEIAKITKFKYQKEYTNGYSFDLENHDYGFLFERKDFEYADNVKNLIKNDEVVVEVNGRYVIGKYYTKDEFVKMAGGEE